MSEESEIVPAVAQVPAFNLDATRNFPEWLHEQQVSIGFSTYQAGKLFLVGLQENGRLSVFERSFNRCMGLTTSEDASTLYMSSLYQLWRFESAFEDGQDYEGYDRLYVPRTGYTTGDLDIHDVAMNADGEPIFISTLFSCIAGISERRSFRVLWQPPFISRLAPEDRCHLNGLAMVDGQPRYVTSVSASDVADGWRDHRIGGGFVMDIQTGDRVADGLSMPHSPRWYANKLWLLDAGSGYFGYVDMNRGKFEPLVFCPGFLRGLAFINNFAVVGLSQARHNRTFQGLALDENLGNKNASPRCGLQIIDLTTGDVVHGLRISGVVEELYDVVTLKGVRRPMMLGFKSDEIQRVLSIEEP